MSFVVPPSGPSRGSAGNPLDEPTDELLRAARGGDLVAWQRLDQRYRRMLVAMMRGRVPAALRGRFDTEDVLQSVFLSAFRELDSYEYKGKGSFLRWMQAVFEHRLIELVREGHAARRDVRKETGLDEDHDDAGRELASRLRTPEDAAETAEEMARTIELLGELDEAEFQIVSRHLIEGESMCQIARELSLPEHRVRRTVSRAIGKLRRSAYPPGSTSD